MFVQAALQNVIDEGGFPFTIRCLNKKAGEEQKGLQAPGQMLTHYAPDVETFLVRKVVQATSASDTAAVGDMAAGSAVYATFVDDAGEPIPFPVEEGGGGGDGGGGGGEAATPASNDDDNEHQRQLDLAKCVVIDFHGALSALQHANPLAYLDMSKVRSHVFWCWKTNTAGESTHVDRHPCVATVHQCRRPM